MRTARQWIGFFIIHLFPKRFDAGIRVIFTDVDANRDECTARIKDALQLTVQAPRRFRLLLNRLRVVVVWSGDYCYSDTFGGVHLPAEDVMGVSTHALASVFIHEATHVRIGRMGIAYRPEYRARIEALCIRTQADFLRSSPNNPDDPEKMARAVERALDTPWWSEADRDANRERVMEENAVPRWLRFVVRGSGARADRRPDRPPDGAP